MTMKMIMAIVFDAAMLIYFGIKTELPYIIADSISELYGSLYHEEPEYTVRKKKAA